MRHPTSLHGYHEALGLESWTDLAHLLGVSPQRVSDWKLGRRRTPKWAMRQLHVLLTAHRAGLEFDELMPPEAFRS